MAIVRVIKDKSNPYVMLNKTCLRDDQLSWKAKGLHSYLLSLPDDWQIYIEDLKNRSKDGKESTSNTIKELINAGYVKRIAKRDSKTNRFIGGFEYEVYEIPINIVEDLPKDTKSRESGNPETGKPDNRESRESGNPSLLNNELKLSNKENKLIINYYQKHIGIITPNLSIKLLSFLEDGMEADVIIRAIDETIGAGVRNFNYLLSILNNWMDLGIKENAQLTEHKNNYVNKKSKNSINKNNGKSNNSNKNNNDEKIDPELLAEMKKQEELLGLN